MSIILLEIANEFAEMSFAKTKGDIEIVPIKSLTKTSSQNNHDGNGTGASNDIYEPMDIESNSGKGHSGKNSSKTADTLDAATLATGSYSSSI